MTAVKSDRSPSVPIQVRGQRRCPLRLHARPASRLQGWSVVPRRKPIQEERSADQDQDRRPAEARPQARLAEGARQAEPATGQFVGVLRLCARRPAYRAVDHHVHDRVRRFLARRHKVQGRGARRFSHAQVFGDSASSGSNACKLDRRDPPSWSLSAESHISPLGNKPPGWWEMPVTDIYPESSRIRESCCVAGDFGFVFRG